MTYPVDIYRCFVSAGFSKGAKFRIAKDKNVVNVFSYNICLPTSLCTSKRSVGDEHRKAIKFYLEKKILMIKRVKYMRNGMKMS